MSYQVIGVDVMDVMDVMDLPVTNKHVLVFQPMVYAIPDQIGLKLFLFLAYLSACFPNLMTDVWHLGSRN